MFNKNRIAHVIIFSIQYESRFEQNVVNLLHFALCRTSLIYPFNERAGVLVRNVVYVMR